MMPDDLRLAGKKQFDAKRIQFYDIRSDIKPDDLVNHAFIALWNSFRMRNPNRISEYKSRNNVMTDSITFAHYQTFKLKS